MDTFPAESRPGLIPIEVLDAVLAEMFTQHCMSGEKLMNLAGRGTTTFRLAAQDGSDLGRYLSGHIITMDSDLYDSILELCSMSKDTPPITNKMEVITRVSGQPTDSRPMPFYLRWLLAAALKLTDRYS